MIGDLVIFGLVVFALGGGGIAAGILLGRRLERRLAAAGEADAIGEPSDDPGIIDDDPAPPPDVADGRSGGAPLVEEVR